MKNKVELIFIDNAYTYFIPEVYEYLSRVSDLKGLSLYLTAMPMKKFYQMRQEIIDTNYMKLHISRAKTDIYFYQYTPKELWLYINYGIKDEIVIGKLINHKRRVK